MTVRPVASGGSALPGDSSSVSWARRLSISNPAHQAMVFSVLRQTSASVASPSSPSWFKQRSTGLQTMVSGFAVAVPGIDGKLFAQRVQVDMPAVGVLMDETAVLPAAGEYGADEIVVLPAGSHDMFPEAPAAFGA